MGENVVLHWGVGRVWAPTLDLLEDEERRCLDLSIMQCSILRQMTFPWVRLESRLVEDHGDYQTTADMPEAYLDALDELETLLSGAYDGPETGCPVGEVFIDRGDNATWDYALPTTLTADGAWHALNFGLLVGSSATRVLLRAFIADTAADAYMMFRKPGYANELNVARVRLGMGVGYDERQLECSIASGGLLSYKISSGMDDALISIQGWWEPAV
jgi:hypothetical protein